MGRIFVQFVYYSSNSMDIFVMFNNIYMTLLTTMSRRDILEV